MRVIIGGVLGALVALVTIAAGVLLIFVVVLAMYVCIHSAYTCIHALHLTLLGCPHSKYTGLKRRHTRLMVSGEPSIRFQTDINVGAVEGEHNNNIICMYSICNYVWILFR